MTRSTASRRARNSASVMIVRRRPASRPSRRRCFFASRRVEPLTATGSSLWLRGWRTRVETLGVSSPDSAAEPARRRRRRRRLEPPSSSASPSAVGVDVGVGVAVGLRLVRRSRRTRDVAPREPRESSVSACWSWVSSSSLPRPRRPLPPRRRRERRGPLSSSDCVASGCSSVSDRSSSAASGSSSSTASAGSSTSGGGVPRRRRVGTAWLASGAWKSTLKLGTAAVGRGVVARVGDAGGRAAPRPRRAPRRR